MQVISDLCRSLYCDFVANSHFTKTTKIQHKILSTLQNTWCETSTLHTKYCRWESEPTNRLVILPQTLVAIFLIQF